VGIVVINISMVAGAGRVKKGKKSVELGWL